MNLMTLDGYRPKLNTTRTRISFAERFLVYLEEPTSMAPILLSFAVSSRSLWRFSLRSARNSESSPEKTFLAGSI